MGYGYHKTAAKRDYNEPEIVKALVSVGAVVFRLPAPADLLVCHHGQYYLLEVKSEKGSMTRSQKNDQRDLERVDCKIHIVRNPKQALSVIGAEDQT